jgi:hypothetical protein
LGENTLSIDNNRKRLNQSMNRASLRYSRMAEFLRGKKDKLSEIMKECKNTNLSYSQDLRMYEKARDKIHSFTRRFDFLRQHFSADMNLGIDDPKVIQAIYYYNKRDLKSREREEKRIVREFRTGIKQSILS